MRKSLVFPLAAVGLVLGVAATTGSAAAITAPHPKVDVKATTHHEVAVIAGGCFWGVEGVYRHVARDFTLIDEHRMTTNCEFPTGGAFAYIQSNGHVRDGIEARDKQFAGVAACDYAYHLLLNSDPAHTLMGELAEAIQAGHPTIKIFMTNIWPHRQGRMVDLGDMWEVFKVLAHEGGLGVIHAEDNDIVMHMYAKMFREGRVGFEHLAEAHNQLSEDISFRRVIRLAESVPGTALYMMHVSAASGVAAIREARARGLPIYGESLHQYMLFTQDDYKRPNGQIYHTYPSLKTKADQTALWDGARDGSINCVATDGGVGLANVAEASFDLLIKKVLGAVNPSK